MTDRAPRRSFPVVWLLLVASGAAGCAALDLPRDFDRGLTLPPPQATAPTATDSLHVVVWNIEWGERIDRALVEIDSDARLRDADLYLLQEVDEADTRELASSLGLGAVWYAASIREGSGRVLGNAVLTRWPVLRSWRVDLPHGGGLRGSPRAASVAELLVGSHPVRAVSAHTSTFLVPPEQRLEQARVVLEAARAGHTGPVVVGADFNSLQEGDEAALRRLFRGAGFRTADLRARSTVETRWKRWLLPHARLDHVFLRGGHVLGAGVVAGTRASDHRPLWVRLVLDDRAGENPPSTNESGFPRGTDPEGS